MTMRLFRILTATVLLSSITSCSLFDSGIEWRGGPYALLWIDTADNISLCRDLGNGSWSGLVDATVYSIGWNGRYVVAKQHPAGDRTKTDYYIIDSSPDSDLKTQSDIVLGPLSKDEYSKKATELKLPDFTRVLASLE